MTLGKRNSELFTRFYHDLLEALTRDCASQAELKLALVLVRLTLGWKGRTEAAISYGEFARRTGLSRHSVAKGLAALQARGIITVTARGGVDHSASIYLLHRHPRDWPIVAAKRILEQPNEETTSKETAPETSQPTAPVDELESSPVAVRKFTRTSEPLTNEPAAIDTKDSLIDSTDTPPETASDEPSTRPPETARAHALAEPGRNDGKRSARHIISDVLELHGEMSAGELWRATRLNYQWMLKCLQKWEGILFTQDRPRGPWRLIADALEHRPFTTGARLRARMKADARQYPSRGGDGHGDGQGSVVEYVRSYGPEVSE